MERILVLYTFEAKDDLFNWANEHVIYLNKKEYHWIIQKKNKFFFIQPLSFISIHSTDILYDKLIIHGSITFFDIEDIAYFVNLK